MCEPRACLVHVEARGTDDCELTNGCREVAPGPLQEQLMFLAAESFLQPMHLLLTMSIFNDIFGHCINPIHVHN